MEKSCGVILFNGQEVLLLQHPDSKNKGHWDFPKGHIENGETEPQTALRELAEETEKLENLRAKLRQTMANSVVCDSKKFAEGFAGLMREIWQNWCLQNS